jgi:methionyl-tRNA formyltransferase
VPAAISVLARDAGVPVYQPESINSAEGLELLRSVAPDLMVTVAYGQILSPEVLAIPALGGINLHGSILPKYRGAAPVARAIQRGETETGVTVIRMSPRVDAGGTIAVARTAIGPDETAGELEARLAVLGAPLVVEVVDRLAAGTVEIVPQDGTQATKAPKLSKDDGRIDWSQPAVVIHNLVRAMQPWPIAFTEVQPLNKPITRLIVHQTRVVEGQGPPGTILEALGGHLIVAAGHGAVELLSVQIPGKKIVSAADLMRGNPLRAGDRVGGDREGDAM